MDIEARINRRQRRDGAASLVLDYGALAPTSHVADPVDRGPALERLLDYFEPVFEGALPGDGYVSGPPGAGKTALVTALVSHLDRLPTGASGVIHTTTRARSGRSPAFVYVDAREAASRFAFYHAVLEGLSGESVPRHGLGTETVRRRLTDLLADRRAVLVVDHVGEPSSVDRTDLADLRAPIEGSTALCAVGRAPAADWADRVSTTVEVPRYQQQVLVDVLMTRASAGLARRALDHDRAQRIAEWAAGDAHDALAALLVAADRASSAGHDRLTDGDVAAGIDDVPRNGASLGRVLALPENRQAVLRELVDLEDADVTSVTATTDAIAAADRVDLSPGTIKRFLYELAEWGILERVAVERTDGQGRPPSRVEPRFPPTAFRLLYDLG
ncbi:MAG: Cdc6/Cdc18 family protein [Haloarculaceae archaeon]